MSTTASTAARTRDHLRGWLAQTSPLIIAFVALIVLCVAFAPSTLRSAALLSTLPFAAVLAIAAIGQGLTIQQGGIDFSVVGAISLAAILVSKVPHGDPGRLVPAILIALGAVAAGGFLSGVAVTAFRVPPIIATLAVNAILLGVAQQYSGSSATQVTENLSTFISGKAGGIPTSVLIAIGFTIVIAAIVGATVVGRRFVVVGSNAETARAAGVRVARYTVGTYVVAALCYGAAAIVLAGYTDLPSTDAGTPYLLSTITAVVIGGTALGGGRGRIVGTAIAAVFLTQLDAFLAGVGGPASTSLLIQSGAVAIAVVAANPRVAGAMHRLRRPQSTT
jgi:ribose transport system permease protein